MKHKKKSQTVRTLQARRQIKIDGLDGNKVPLTLYTQPDSGSEALAVLVYFHSGGGGSLL